MTPRHRHTRRLAALLGAALLATWTTAQPVRVGNPGNAPDPEPLPDGTTGLGSVGYVYDISRTEVSVAEYVAFLNAVARSDPNGLFDPFMQDPPSVFFAPEQYAQINRFGTSGNFSYSVVPGFIPPTQTRHSRADVPVLFINFPRAVRFANWLHNGQPTGPQGPGTTEDGAYRIENRIFVRNPGARWAIPTLDEWHKAAYGNVGDNYTLFALGSDTPPSAWLCDLGPPIGNANLFRLDQLWVDQPTPVGCYPESSFWGAKDMHGNAMEWTEERRGLKRVLIGGNMRTLDGSGGFDPSGVRTPIPANELFNGVTGDPSLLPLAAGFRVVRLCPPDLTGEGVIDANDFFEFLALFQDADPRVDFIPDGTIDANDFFAFLQLFQEGCP